MLIRPIASLIENAVTVCSSRLVQWPRVIVYSNCEDVCDPHTKNGLQKANDLTQFTVPEVFIGRYPPGTLVLGGDTFWVLVGQILGLEQIIISNELLPIFAPNPDAILAAVTARIGETEDVAEECVLLARYGWRTWGHWLNEILCKAVISEAVFPGRFRYAVPALLGRRAMGPNFTAATIESLAAYGIAEDRLIRIESGRNHRFRSLFDVAGCTIWAQSGVILHPAVSALMRERLREPVPRLDSPLLAIERSSPTRTLQNVQQVNSKLSSRGFVFIDPRALTFREQIGYFRGAKTVFSVYGSGLANVLYAINGIRVLACAPAPWLDAYFMYTVKERSGRYADVRGPSSWNGIGEIFRAPFSIDPALIEIALDHLDSAEPRSRVDS